MTHDERLFIAELFTIVLIFILAFVDFETIYVIMEETWIGLVRFYKSLEFKVWLWRAGIPRNRPTDRNK